MPQYQREVREMMAQRRPVETKELRRRGELDALVDRVDQALADAFGAQMALGQERAPKEWTERVQFLESWRGEAQAQAMDSLSAMVAWEPEAMQQAQQAEGLEEESDQQEQAAELELVLAPILAQFRPVCRTEAEAREKSLEYAQTVGLL